MPQANNLKIWEQFLWRFCREFFIDWFCNCSKFLGFLLWNFLRDSTGNLIKTFSSNSIYWEIRPTKKILRLFFKNFFFSRIPLVMPFRNASAISSKILPEITWEIPLMISSRVSLTVFRDFLWKPPSKFPVEALRRYFSWIQPWKKSFVIYFRNLQEKF